MTWETWILKVRMTAGHLLVVFFMSWYFCVFYVCFVAINASLPSNLNSPVKSPSEGLEPSFFIHNNKPADQSKLTMSRVSSVSPGDVITNDDDEMCREEDSGIGLFRCGQCNKAFPQRSVLQLHICSRAPSKSFECGFCGNAFGNPNDLRAHSAVHFNEKPFKCGYCSRAFSGATTLNNHIRRHTGDMPFKCQNCNKTFSHGAQLSRHQRMECRQVSSNELQSCSWLLIAHKETTLFHNSSESNVQFTEQHLSSPVLFVSRIKCVHSTRLM